MNDGEKSNNKIPFLAVDQSCDVSKLYTQLLIFFLRKANAYGGRLSFAGKRGGKRGVHLSEPLSFKPSIRPTLDLPLAG